MNRIFSDGMEPFAQANDGGIGTGQQPRERHHTPHSGHRPLRQRWLVWLAALLLVGTGARGGTPPNIDATGLTSQDRAQLTTLAATLHAQSDRITSVRVTASRDNASTAMHVAAWLIAQGVPSRLVSTGAAAPTTDSCAGSTANADTPACRVKLSPVKITVTY